MKKVQSFDKSIFLWIELGVSAATVIFKGITGDPKVPACADF